VSPIRKTAIRRDATRKSAEKALKNLLGAGDVYENYRALYSLWCSHNSAVPELRPLFRIPGIEADGTLSVNDEFRRKVRSLAREILPQISSEKAIES